MKRNIVKFLGLSLFIIFSSIYDGYADQVTIVVLDLEVPEHLKAQQISLSDRLRSELVNTGKFIIVERGKMKQMLEEQELPLYGIVDSNSAAKIGKLLGAKQIVAGSLSKVGSIFSISTRIVDVESGKVVITADMDCECSIEDVLVITLKNVARKLAGLPVEEDGYSKAQKKLPPVFSLEEVAKYSLPFHIESYGDIVFGGDRIYIGTYDGNIYRINTALGIKVEEVYIAKNSQISALGWDGTHVWAATMGNGNIIRYKKEATLLIDYIFRVEGADTYPHGIALDGNNIYTVGYSKKLMHYKLMGPTGIKKVDEIDIGERLSSLTIVDGRLFTVGLGNVLVEIVDNKLNRLPVKNFVQTPIGIAYDGKYFWVLTDNSVQKQNLTKYRVIEAREDVPSKPTITMSTQINVTGYDYPPKRPVGIAWDGKTIWTMSDHGFYSHKLDMYLSVAHEYIPENTGVPVNYGYGSFAWDGEYFLTTGARYEDINDKLTHYLIRLKYVESDGSSTGIQKLQVIEASKLPFDNSVNAITWVDGYLWVATGQNTRTSGEGSFIHKMKQTAEGRWEIVKTFKSPGYRCQGLAWDGKNLWSYDVFTMRFYKHQLNENLSVIAEYIKEGGRELMYFSGLTWDGEYFWAGNYGTDKIYKIVFK